MILTTASLSKHANTQFGVSEWLTIDQERIDQFAACSGDFQWMHVDRERAKEGPYGATVAHGYLILSLIPVMSASLWGDPSGLKGSFNYGLDRVRFSAPVKCGDRIRDRVTLTLVDDMGGGRVLLVMDHVIEIEGQETPALVATTLAMAMG